MGALGREERTDAIRRIQAYFRAERNEEMGDLAAGLLLDFIESDIAPMVYNQGVNDAKAVATRFSGLLDEEIDGLRVLAPKSKGTR